MAKTAASSTTTTTAAAASAIDYAEVGRRYETFRRLERRIAALRIADPHSGELHARGELQRAHDAARAAVRELIDVVIDAEREQSAAAGE